MPRTATLPKKHGRAKGHGCPTRLSVTLREESRLSKPSRVDPETGLIVGVKLVGKTSTNTHGVQDVDGSEYTDEALQEAIPFYEGAYGYLNHRSRKSETTERDVREKFCRYFAVELREDGLYGNMAIINPKTEFAGTLLRAADAFPDAFGLSHDATGDGEIRNRMFVITKIPSVNSVDVVDHGATTRSLFESKEASPMPQTKKKASEILLTGAKALGKTHLRLAESYLATDAFGLKEIDMLEDDGGEPEDKVAAAFKEACNAIMDGEDDDATKIKKLKEVFKAKTRIASAEEPKETDSGDKGAKDEKKEPDKDDKKTQESREANLARENSALRELLESGVTGVPASVVKALSRLDDATERREAIAAFKKGQPAPTPPARTPRSESPGTQIQESRQFNGANLADPVQLANALRN